jgi:hypothetical protein
MDEEGVLGASVTLKMKESKDPGVEPHKVTICCVLLNFNRCRRRVLSLFVVYLACVFAHRNGAKCGFYAVSGVRDMRRPQPHPSLGHADKPRRCCCERVHQTGEGKRTALPGPGLALHGY